MIRDAAGRLFASFVVEVAQAPLPQADQDRGIGLGLTHFAVLYDGTGVASPGSCAGRRRNSKDRPLRAGQPGLLRLRRERRPQAARRPRVGLQTVRHII